MKQSSKVPIFGQPVFVIKESNIEDKVVVVGERGYLNSLVYFAVNAILVASLRYEKPGDLNKIVINEGLVDAEDNNKSLEIHMDIEKNFSGEAGATTIFVDEELAQAVAKKMNENQKRNCKKLVDLINKAYNTYDEIIASCTVNAQ